MAIALDSANTGSRVTGSQTTVSYSHTTSGSDRLLIAIVAYSPTTDRESSVTYNGVAMTRLATNTAGSVYRISVYYLIAPATGSNTLTATLSGAVGDLRMASVSYTGVKQTGFPDASGTATGNGNTPSRTITTVANNCWVGFAVASQDQPGGGTTAGTNVTGRVGTGVTYASADTTYGDNNAAVTPAGNLSQSVTVGDADDPWAVIQFSFAPSTGAPAGATTPTRTLLGVGT